MSGWDSYWWGTARYMKFIEENFDVLPIIKSSGWRNHDSIVKDCFRRACWPKTKGTRTAEAHARRHRRSEMILILWKNFSATMLEFGTLRPFLNANRGRQKKPPDGETTATYPPRPPRVVMTAAIAPFSWPHSRSCRFSTHPSASPISYRRPLAELSLGILGDIYKGPTIDVTPDITASVNRIGCFLRLQGPAPSSKQNSISRRPLSWQRIRRTSSTRRTEDCSKLPCRWSHTGGVCASIVWRWWFMI